VGLLAAVGAIASALVGFVHGDLASATVGTAGAAAGLAAYLAESPSKKILSSLVPRGAAELGRSAGNGTQIPNLVVPRDLRGSCFTHTPGDLLGRCLIRRCD
jgi:hypothetical protein